jgi:hypothetical protein
MCAWFLIAFVFIMALYVANEHTAQEGIQHNCASSDIQNKQVTSRKQNLATLLILIW